MEERILTTDFTDYTDLKREMKSVVNHLPFEVERGVRGQGGSRFRRRALGGENCGNSRWLGGV
jgi:hypothetical protein